MYRVLTDEEVEKLHIMVNFQFFLILKFNILFFISFYLILFYFFFFFFERNISDLSLVLEDNHKRIREVEYSSKNHSLPCLKKTLRLFLVKLVTFIRSRILLMSHIYYVFWFFQKLLSTHSYTRSRREISMWRCFCCKYTSSMNHSWLLE